jgi:NAD(P)-dependent dehydrogenase (short-subunit alcohol dehydrogenase family)
VTSTASGKTVFVTGGARGIGKAIVSALAADGFNVSFTYSASADEAGQLAEELRVRYPAQDVQGYCFDLADRAQVDELANVIAGTDPLFGLVHNAGRSYDTLAALVDQDRAEALFQVNFWAMTRLAGVAAQPLMRAKSGRIIVIGSITAERAVQGNSIYAASKGAVLSYVRTLAIELARKGVTVNCISPGYVDTEMMAPYAAYRDKVETQIPLRRFGQPEEVGALASFLFSPHAGYITGTVIPIDGGVSAGLSVQR